MSERGSHRGEELPETGEIDLRVLGAGIWRRRLWIIGPTIVATLLAIAFVQLTSPYFRSSALVLIENNASLAPGGANAARETPLPDEQAVATQVQFIESRDLVRKVARDLDLGRDSEFAANGDRSLARRLLGFLGFAASDDSQPVSEQVVDKVAANLSAYPVSGARVIGVEFVSTNPDTAAKVANGFVDAFFDVQREAKRDVNRQATTYFSGEIEQLRQRVAEAEGKVEAFRSQAGLLVGQNNTTLAAQQLGESSTQLGTARTQQAEARAKADAIRDYLRAGRAAEALDIANSDVVRALVQQRSQLAAQIASEGRTLLGQHPRMRELAAQLSGLDGQIRNEAEKLARAYENEAKTAGARVAALSSALDAQKQNAATANERDVELRALEREARAARDLLEQMLARYREAAARDNPDALMADARIISRAAAPTEAYFPKKAPTVALAAIAAFVLALFAAATAEVFGGGARRRDGVTAAPPPPPAIGEVPVFGRLHGPQPSAQAEVKPSSDPTPTETSTKRATPALSAQRIDAIEVADATLVAALARQLASMPTTDGALRILAAGAHPGVRVDEVVTELARTMSESGRRVVAVDAGGGAPRASDADRGPGLAELLAGSATFAQAIHRDPGSRVHVVPRGEASFDELDRASQARVGVVLDALALTYDFVLLTAAPGAAVSDIFSQQASAAILVSNAGAGDLATVEAHDKLKAHGIEDVVVLLVRDGDGAPEGGSRLAA
ncbi:GumC family protein [Methylopila turkensis]|uniref:Chain-length determining protein n=1 Tax=Methylopila turkensis TaxID=1437816 RepID=A0A9W6JPE9_9HYPH|nr:exopolysaccharide transport family protein [Methylopila turkensis]GLK80842.1 chain-length determining protein [Methylopila turkensis]